MLIKNNNCIKIGPASAKFRSFGKVKFKNKFKIKGTGNILQDLIYCSVLVDKDKMNKNVKEQDNEQNQKLSTFSSSNCSLCQNNGTNIHLLSSKESDVLFGLLFSTKSKKSNGLFSSAFTHACQSCGDALIKYMELKKRLEIMSISLKTLGKLQLKKLTSYQNFMEEEMIDNLNLGIQSTQTKSDINDHNLMLLSSSSNNNEDPFGAIWDPEIGVKLENLSDNEFEDPTGDFLEFGMGDEIDNYEQNQIQEDPLGDVVIPRKQKPSFKQDVDYVQNQDGSRLPPRPNQPKRESRVKAEKIMYKSLHSDDDEDDGNEAVDSKDQDYQDLYAEEAAASNSDDADDDWKTEPLQIRQTQGRGRGRPKKVSLQKIKIQNDEQENDDDELDDGNKSCSICVMDFINGAKFKKHLVSLTHFEGTSCRKPDTKDGVIVFCCNMELCDHEEATVQKIVEHKETVHKNEKIRCNDCNLEIKSRRNYRDHVLSERHLSRVGGDIAAQVEKQKKFMCFYCRKKFPTKRILQKHRHSHVNYRPLSEPRNKKIKRDPQYDTEDEEENNKDGIGECDICDLKFNSEKYYQSHLISLAHFEGENSRKVDDNGKIIFSCDMCTCHQNPDEGQETPQISSFETLKELRKHKDTFHPGANTCIPCKLSFKRIRNYKEHLFSERHLVKVGGHLEAKKLYKCSLCSRAFLNYRLLRQHKQGHKKYGSHLPSKPKTQKKPSDTENSNDDEDKDDDVDWWINCDLCKLVFSSGKKLRTHLTTLLHFEGKHSRKVDDTTGSISFVCDMCPPNQDEGQENVEVSFPTLQELREHKNVEHLTARNKCITCRMFFKDIRIYRDHLFSERHITMTGESESVEKPFQCPYPSCIKSYPSARILKKHFGTHFNKKRRNTDIEGDVDVNREELSNSEPDDDDCSENDEQKAEESKKCSKVCVECDNKTFSRTDHYYRHLRIVHGTEPINKKRKLTSDEIANRKICPVCSKKMSSRTHMLRHLKNVHQNPEKNEDGVAKSISKVKSTKPRPKTCTECNSTFKRTDHLLRHYRAVHGTHLKKIKSNKGDDEDVEENHDDNSLLKCDECNLTFLSEAKSEKHFLSMTHFEGSSAKRVDPDGNVSYVCNMCSQNQTADQEGEQPIPVSFPNLKGLLAHKQTSHKGEKIICAPCGLELKDGRNYRDHLLSTKHVAKIQEIGGGQIIVHIEKKFHCTVPNCSKTFPTARILTKHLSNHKKSIVCEKCGHVTTSLAGLKRHQQAVHPENELENFNNGSDDDIDDDDDDDYYEERQRKLKRKTGRKSRKKGNLSSLLPPLPSTSTSTSSSSHYGEGDVSAYQNPYYLDMYRSHAFPN